MVDALFYLTVLDDDRKVFSIHGPMADDTYWIDRVHDCQSAGREVHCASTPATLAREELERDAEGRGYHCVSDAASSSE